MVLLIEWKNHKAMKDVLMLVAVFAVGYIVSMGVLYGAFRIFFPVKVEKIEPEMNFGAGSPVMKIARDARAAKSPSRIPKIKLAHG